jgi:hypothetical protein
MWEEVETFLKVKKMIGYKIFCYWVNHYGLKRVKENLKEKGIQLTDEARISCRLLRASVVG